jgi:DNA-binding PadR family transcriptional regulator
VSASGEEHLPFKPTDFLVLLSLHEGDRHGYAIVKDIEKHSEGHVRLAPGNLYGVLARLLDRGLIEEAPGRGGDPRRRLYRLTATGRAALRAETRRLKRLVALVEGGRPLRGAEGA